MTSKKSFFRKWFWLVGSGLGLVIIGSLAFTQFGLFQPAVSITQQSYQTAVVKLGDVSLTITGTGTLEPRTTVDLSFASSGTVGTLDVQMGDQVSAGETLATLAEINELEINLQTKQLELETAKKTLQDLVTGGNAALAQSLSDRASAQSAYQEATQNLRYEGETRCTQEAVEKYFDASLSATNEVAKWEKNMANSANNDFPTSFMQQQIANANQEAYFAAYNLAYCEGYTDQEILESQANLLLTKEEFTYLDGVYQNLVANAGIDPAELEIAQAEVDNAEQQVEEAQIELTGATIIAPMDGTIMQISAGLGDPVGTGALITLSDLTNQLVQVVVDETDLENFQVDCPAIVTFSAFPNHTYEGKIVQILPSIANDMFVFGAQGVVQLNDVTLIPGLKLPTGLSGSVDITCDKAQNVLLIPIAALYETSGSPAFVYILDQDGQPEKRNVEIGVIGDTYVEIQSGLSEGDKVITSTMAQN
jgi:HlyD family secretion protein